MFVRLAKFAALGMMLYAGAAHAAAGSSATVVLQTATAEPAAKAVEKQYCVRTTLSGSRMPQKVCRTRKGWLAEGFDPAAPAN